MLIPYKDTNPLNKKPIITLLIIIINIVFFYLQMTKHFTFDVTQELSLIPLEFFTGKNLNNSGLISPYATVITYMFLHGSISHLVFNMLFLWIFGNNIEDRMSAIGFIFFYMITGVISGVSFAFIDPKGTYPLIGASGAISGILGAYLFLYPFAKIHALLFIFRVKMPAIVFIIIWFVSQVSGLLISSAETNNIAWLSHISGFISGIIFFRIFIKRLPVKI